MKTGESRLCRGDSMPLCLFRASVWVAVVLSGFGAAPAIGAERGASVRRPNIVFIMADDHTSQAGGCHDDPKHAAIITRLKTRLTHLQAAVGDKP